MARIDTQNIPSELLARYETALGIARPWKTKETVGRRYPWRLPHMQGNGIISPTPVRGWGVTPAQVIIRKRFAQCVHCFNRQPYEDGEEPPDIGFRSRPWWYNAANSSGLWYYDYFIQQTMLDMADDSVPAWCKWAVWASASVSTVNPDTPWWIERALYIQLGAGEPPSKYWTYLKPYGEKEYLWLFVGGCANGECDTQLWTISWWKVSDAWNPNTITWNNKPEPTEKMGEVSFRGISKWISLWIGEESAIVIKLESPAGSFYRFEGSDALDEGFIPNTRTIPA